MSYWINLCCQSTKVDVELMEVTSTLKCLMRDTKTTKREIEKVEKDIVDLHKQNTFLDKSITNFENDVMFKTDHAISLVNQNFALENEVKNTEREYEENAIAQEEKLKILKENYETEKRKLLENVDNHQQLWQLEGESDDLLKTVQKEQEILQSVLATQLEKEEQQKKQRNDSIIKLAEIVVQPKMMKEAEEAIAKEQKIHDEFKAKISEINAKKKEEKQIRPSSQTGSIRSTCSTAGMTRERKNQIKAQRARRAEFMKNFRSTNFTNRGLNASVNCSQESQTSQQLKRPLPEESQSKPKKVNLLEDITFKKPAAPPSGKPEPPIQSILKNPLEAKKMARNTTTRSPYFSSFGFGNDEQKAEKEGNQSKTDDFFLEEDEGNQMDFDNGFPDFADTEGDGFPFPGFDDPSADGNVSPAGSFEFPFLGSDSHNSLF